MADIARHTDTRVEANLSSDLLPLYLQRFDRANSRRAYHADISGYFGTEEISLEDAREVTFVAINRFIASLEAAGQKPSTIQRKISALRGFFDWLMALGMIERNPAHRKLVRRVHAVSFRDRPVFVLTVDQADRLLSAAAGPVVRSNDPDADASRPIDPDASDTLVDAGPASSDASVRDHAMLTVMLHCVLRRSEVAAMDVEHVRPLGSYWILDLPLAKGGADQFVKIPEHVVDVLNAMCAHYGITSGPLWRSLSNRSRGKRLSSNAIYEIVRRTALRAGLPEIGAHTLRHTGCTLAIEAGASLQQVQSHARHKKIETTMVYIHQRDRLRDSAADFIRLGNRKK